MGKRGTVYNKLYNDEDWSKVNKLNKNLMDDFIIEYKSRKKKPSTIKQYGYDIRYILLYVYKKLENKYILELNKKHFRNMTLWFTDTCGMSNARCNRLMSSLRSLLDYAENDDDYDYDINYAKKIQGLPKEEVREICFITDEQVTKLRNYLKENKEYQKMAILDLAYDSAGRRNELFQVKKDNLIGQSATNQVIGKRGKKFKLLMFSHSQESLKLYLDERGEDSIEELWTVGKGENKRPATYTVLYDWFVEMSEILSKIEGKEIPFNVHSFRHSSLNNMKNNTHYMCKELGRKEGFSLEELKFYAHHSNSETTAGYVQSNDDNVLEHMFHIKLEDE